MKTLVENSNRKISAESIGFFLKRKSFRKIVGTVVVYILLVLGAIVILTPFLWMLSTALKVPGREFIYPPEWIPNPPQWSNFTKGWMSLPFNRWLINSATVTGFTIVGAIVSSSLVAYGFARLQFPGRNVLFIILLSTMMLPFHVRLIPSFIIFRYLGWVNTYLPLIVPAFLGGVPFFIFLVRQFFMTIPLEMEEAATIDGAGIFRCFLTIILPLSKPVLGVISVFAFMRSWNAFLQPLIYIHSMEKFTLALGLRFFQDQDFTEWNLLMAVSILVLLPCLGLFFIAQKYYIQGVVTTGLKE